MAILTSSTNPMPAKNDGVDERWRKNNTSGKKAFDKGDYRKAEKHWEKALKDAECFCASDPRLHLSLCSLGLLYNLQGRYEEAVSLFARSTAIWESHLFDDLS